jgi:tRNA threonylcarbamoyladenosine biosynthesis protein TsaB
MKLIAVETSGRTGGVAAADGGAVVAVRSLGTDRRHAAGLLPAVDALLRDLGWKPSDLGAVAVSAGPGGFTGLRISVTFAKSLALATGAKVVAVPSLDVLAENAPPEAGHVGVVLDARRGAIFSALYRRTEAGLVRVRPPAVAEPAALLSEAGRPLFLLGEGLSVAAHAAALTAEGVTHEPPDRWNADPSVTARLALRMAAEGRFADADRLTPVYLRRPEAEETWIARYGPDSVIPVGTGETPA